jgi:pimeloyl-ACP methyl ester carboxylesterase
MDLPPLARLLDLPDLCQRLEIQWLHPEPKHDAPGHVLHPHPTLVFLHEGLGSITQWRQFPQALCNALGWPGLIYARQGYGQSSACVEPFNVDFMHREAFEVLPAVLKATGVQRAILVGHSDGGSIALLYASRAAAHPPLQLDPPAPCAVVVLAPHLFVETEGVQAIQAARRAFENDPTFRARLARHHRDVESMFYQWADVWTSEAFSAWNITDAIKCISCPILAIQGTEDQYGSLTQIRQIAALASASPEVNLLEIADCKHLPHLEKPEIVLAQCTSFLRLYYESGHDSNCTIIPEENIHEHL